MGTNEQQCTETVHEKGRGIWTHQCMYKALPGTTKCGIHTPNPDLQARAETPRAMPEVEIRRKATVRFEWEPGDGAITTYSSRRVQWDAISVEVPIDETGAPDLDRASTYVLGAHGAALRRDGSRGTGVNGNFLRVEDVPGLMSYARVAFGLPMEGTP